MRKSRSQTSASSEEGSTSPTQSVFTKLKRRLSPKKSEYRDGVKEVSTIGSPPPSSPGSPPLATTSKLSIEPHTPKTEKLERVFQYFDEDGDGKVSPAELQTCVRTIGGELSSIEAATVVESLDSDGDGLLGLEDFAKLMNTSGEEEENKDLKQAFGMYEMEGSGCITPTSLNRMLSRLGEPKSVEECKKIIGTFDLNGDGVLSFEEFRAMMG